MKYYIKFRWDNLYRLTMALLTCLLAEQTVAQNSIVLREGVVLNKSTGEIFLMAPDEKMEVISSKTGKTVFKTNEKVKPLGLINDRLFGQSSEDDGNALLFKSFDIKRKGRFVLEDSILLPANRNFRLITDNIFQARSKTIKGDLYLLWEYQASMHNTFDKDSLAIPGDLQLGVIKVDKSSGKTTLIDNTPAEFEKSVLVADNNRLGGVEGEQYFSADEKHILVSKLAGSDTAFNKYLWTIYDRAGKKIGAVRDYRSYIPFYVQQNTLFYETGPYIKNTINGIEEVPLQITAIDLSTGKVIWNKSIYDNITLKNSPPAGGIRQK